MADFSIKSLDGPIQPAGKKFGIRGGAYFIDAIINIITIYATSFAVSFTIGVILTILGQTFIIDDESTGCLNFIITIMLQISYFTIFEWLFGATPGKVIFGMRVIKEDGKPCTFSAALKRALFRYIDGLLFGIPAYSSMKPPLYQRYGDKSADTVVVSSKDPAIQEQVSWFMFFVAAALYIIVSATGAFMLLMVSIL